MAVAIGVADEPRVRVSGGEEDRIIRGAPPF